jgi:malate/lactate dehydrogenase
MRSKITVIGDTEAAAVAALLLGRRELADVVLVDTRDGLADDLAAAADAEGFAPWVTAGDWRDAAGSDVVVAGTLPDGAARELSERCPRSVVVVVTPDTAADVASLLDATRFPRGRVIGAVGGGGGPLGRGAVAAAIADAVLRDRGRELRAAVLCRPEEDQDDGVWERTVRIGATGVEQIL